MHISFNKMNLSHAQETHSGHVYCVCVCVCSVMSNSLWSHELQPARLLCPWDFPGKNTGVGCHFLLQGIYLTQIKSVSTALQVDSLTLGPPWKPLSPWEGYQNECVHRVVKFIKVKYFNSSQLWLLPVSTAISPHFGWCRMVTSIWGLVLGHWLRMHFVWVSWQTWFSVAFMCEVSADSFKPAKQRVGAILRLSVQFSSVTRLCLNLWYPRNCSTPGHPIHHQSHPLSSPSPATFNHSQHQGLVQWVSSWCQVAKIHLVYQKQSLVHGRAHKGYRKWSDSSLSQERDWLAISIGVSASAQSFQWIFRTDFL